MPNYLISQNLANSILNYLSKRPWEEADALIQEMRKMPAVQEPAAEVLADEKAPEEKKA